MTQQLRERIINNDDDDDDELTMMNFGVDTKKLLNFSAIFVNKRSWSRFVEFGKTVLSYKRIILKTMQLQ